MRTWACVAICGSCLLLGHPLHAQETIATGTRGGVLSADGRVVAYVAGDQVYVRDLQTATTTLESVADDGLGRPGSSGDSRDGAAEGGSTVSLDATGRHIAFASTSPLDPADDDAGLDVYVRDRIDGRTRRASLASDGGAPNGPSWAPRLSGDGRFVAFTSAASNLVPGDTNGLDDVFVHDRALRTTVRVTVSSTGAQGDQPAMRPAIDESGSAVAFVSRASTLVPEAPPNCAFFPDVGETLDCAQIFVHDLRTGTTRRPSPAENGLVWLMADISGDGRLVAGVADRVSRGHTIASSFFVADAVTGATVLEGVSAGSRVGSPIARYADLSADGRTLAFGPNVDGDAVEFHAIPRASDASIRNRGIDETLRTDHGRYLSVSGDGMVLLQAGPPVAASDVGIVLRLFRRDADGDRMLDAWERLFGLDPARADGDDDTDGDEVTNLAEFVQGGNPAGGVLHYLAEGSANAWFRTAFAIANPHDVEVTVALRLVAAAGAGDAGRALRLAPRSQARVELTPLVDGAFAAIVESSRPIAADRTMTWDATAFGSSAAEAVGASRTWHFAEGATGGGFDTFFLIFNPAAQAATVSFAFLRPAPARPIVMSFPAVPPQSRVTLHVDARLHRELAATDVAARVTASLPVVVERAMYVTTGGVTFAGGHAAVGAPAAAARWYFAEGATGPFFDTFLLAMNPGLADARLRVTYVLPDGPPIEKHYVLPHESRLTIAVDGEDARLANTPVAAIVDSLDGVPVVVERAMWWPEGAWHEGHASGGAVAAATRWTLPRVELGGPGRAETYILILNPGDAPARVRLAVLSRPSTYDIEVPARSRVSVPLSLALPGIRDNGPLGLVVESDGAGIVVERSIYTDSAGVAWAAGTVALATPLP